MTVRNGFIYIWYDCKRKMYYIGSHWGTEDDGYICSSNRMRDAYRRRPEDFKRRILLRLYSDRKQLLEHEEVWLKKAEKKKERYYNNQFRTMRSNYSRKGIKWSLESKLQRSEDVKKLWQNEEYRFKTSKHLKGRIFSEETKQKMSLSKQNVIMKEETKQKISKTKTGKRHSEETKQKISKTKTGMKYNKSTKYDINILPR